MTLHRLQIFAVVAKHVSVTKAAQQLHISQPSVSKLLALLQEDLRMKLLEKDGCGIKITPQGESLLEAIKPSLVRLGRFENELAMNTSAPAENTLNVGGSHGPSAAFLPSLMSEFKKVHPGISLSLRTGNRIAVEQLVLKGEIEVAVITTPTNSDFLVTEPCRPEKLAAFVSVHHPLAKKKTATLPDLLQTPLVIRGGRGTNGRTREILSGLEAQGYTPIIEARYESPDAVKAAVRENAGVGFLYRDIVRPDVRRGDFKILKVRNLRLDSQSFIIYHKDRPLSAHAGDFLDLLRKRRPAGQTVGSI